MILQIKRKGIDCEPFIFIKSLFWNFILKIAASEAINTRRDLMVKRTKGLWKFMSRRRINKNKAQRCRVVGVTYCTIRLVGGETSIAAGKRGVVKSRKLNRPPELPIQCVVSESKNLHATYVAFIQRVPPESVRTWRIQSMNRPAA